jgi:hypothetical protein
MAAPIEIIINKATARSTEAKKFQNLSFHLSILPINPPYLFFILSKYPK